MPHIVLFEPATMRRPDPYGCRRIDAGQPLEKAGPRLVTATMG